MKDKKIAHVSISRDKKIQELKASQRSASAKLKSAMERGKKPLVGIAAAPSVIKHGIKEKALIKERLKVENEPRSKYYTQKPIKK